MKPYVSIIMPVYNAERFIEKSINSILIQNYENFELIIIDDASSDSSLKIIERYTNKKIVLLKNKVNLGIAKSLNLGVSIARGEYIARMDADDIMLKNKIIDQITYMKNNKLDFCGTYIRFFGQIKRKIKYPILNDDIRFFMLFGCPFAHPTIIFKKKLILNINFEHRPAEDFALWTKIATNKNIKFGNLPNVYLNYRVHKNQISSDKTKIIKDTLEICKVYASSYLNNNLLKDLNKLNFGMNEKYNASDTTKLIKCIYEISKEKSISKKTISFIIISFLNKTERISFSKFFNLMFMILRLNFFSIKFITIFTFIFIKQFLK